MKNCPNTSCQNYTGTPKNWYVKNGYYKLKSTNQKTPRYQCKACKKNFSTHTGLNSVNQKKPKINQELFKLLVSGVSLRRASKILEMEYNMVVAHFNYLADVVHLEHYKHLKTIQTTFVQVDEMETYLHARAKPLSVPLVVRVKTGGNLGLQCCQNAC
jgi:transposase-like protein